MAEYIEREKVYEILNAALNETDKLDGLFSGDYIRGCKNTLSKVTDDIQKTPSADVRPERHGEWLVSGECYECSECGGGSTVNTNPYCWKCGAKMDGKDGESG